MIIPHDSTEIRHQVQNVARHSGYDPARHPHYKQPSTYIASWEGLGKHEGKEDAEDTAHAHAEHYKEHGSLPIHDHDHLRNFAVDAAGLAVTQHHHFARPRPSSLDVSRYGTPNPIHERPSTTISSASGYHKGYGNSYRKAFLSHYQTAIKQHLGAKVAATIKPAADANYYFKSVTNYTPLIRSLAKAVTNPQPTRRFEFVRDIDVSGTSGTGVPIVGLQFPDGRVAARWVTQKNPNSTELWDSIEDFEQIHGHGGASWVRWLDDEQGRQLAKPVMQQIGKAK